MNSNEDNIIGFFESCEHVYNESSEEEKYKDKQHEVFLKYIWGEGGLSERLKALANQSYGQDLALILIELKVFPGDFSLQYIKDIDRYSAKEKAVSVSIIIDDETFFNKSEVERQQYLRDSILDRLYLVADMVRRKKLDTDMDKLISDVQNVFPVQNTYDLSKKEPAIGDLKRKTGILGRLFGHKSVKELPDTQEQSPEEDLSSIVVTASFRSGKELGTEQEQQQMIKLENKLRDAIEEIGGDVDGHDIGKTSYSIYIYGEHVDELFAVANPILAKANLYKGEVLKRHGGFSSPDFHEEVVKL